MKKALKLTITLDKTSGEYCVNYILNGRRNENRSYYTDDKADARETKEAMQREFDDQQHKVKVSGGYVKYNGLTLGLGNHKLDSSILIFNLPAISTCPNCKACADTCYALQAEKRYPAVLPCRERNHKASLGSAFVVDMVKLIKHGVARYGVKAVRVHESGDFYSQEYANKWDSIAFAVHAEYPEVKFFAYTKSPYRPLSGFNIVESILPDGSINYGPWAYVIEKAIKYHAVICPYGLTKVNFKGMCGVKCKACQNKKHVLFLQH